MRATVGLHSTLLLDHILISLVNGMYRWGRGGQTLQWGKGVEKDFVVLGAQPLPHTPSMNSHKGKIDRFFFLFYCIKIKKNLSLQKHYKQHLIANDKFYKMGERELR